jgi:hypothetical protein
VPEPLRINALQQLFEVFSGKVGVIQNTLQQLGMEDPCSVKWDGCTLTGGVLEDHVASALAGEREASPFKNRNDLPGS